MKKVHLLFILFFCAATILTSNHSYAASVPEPAGNIYVQDFANILTSKQKNDLIKLGTFMDKESEVQIVVLTVDSLENVPVEEYATAAFEKYELGSGNENNGVLMLFALSDRKIYIEVGSDLKDKLNDKVVGKIIDTHALPYLEEGELSQAISNTYKKLFNEVADEYGIKKQVKTESFEYGYDEGKSRLLMIIYIFIFLGIIYLDYRFLKSAIILTILRMIAVIIRTLWKLTRKLRSKM
ncbi:TPM domain-containing protein [Bacillus sp. FJAT-49732]|uniref:TPM domain-containing protein n=1 Tax=Lederbergia citrisecunda TaxID=2833583 RepID=A0A942YK86_9BACI|nr:TPM domain-containing protein [Lederbergia citrisecunda]MBS4199397.1 TPM domain-containing protein [Lederbergia citrisecunda]